jgi:hypothetical protein
MDIDGRKENKRLLSSMRGCHCAITLSQMSRICSLLATHLLSVDMFHRETFSGMDIDNPTSTMME